VAAVADAAACQAGKTSGQDLTYISGVVFDILKIRHWSSPP
jgi:hypothetical protein